MALTRPSFNQINSTVTSLNDPLTVVNKTATSASQDIGFIFNRDGGATANVAIVWDETNDQFVLVNTSSSGATNANVTISSYANAQVNQLQADLIKNREQRYTTSNMMKFNQLYTGAAAGSYFTQNEYQKIVTIIPASDSENYQVSGRILCQNAGSIQTINFKAALRSGDPLPDLSWSITYDQEHNGTAHFKPQLWTKETTTAGFIFAIQKISSGSLYGTVTVDLDIIPRSSGLLDNVTVNTTQNSEQTSIDAGYTANDMTLVKTVDSTDTTFSGNTSSIYFIGDGSQLTNVGAGASYGNTQVGTFLETYNGALLTVTTANIGQIGYTDNKVTTANIGQIGFTNETVTQANVGLKGYTDSQLSAKSSLSGATFTGNVSLGDSNYLNIGAGPDLTVYHDGSNSYIDDVGTGSMFVRSGTTYFQNATGTKTSISTNAGAGQSIYHNNALKLVTTATGITVTGTVAATSYTGDGSALTGIQATTVTATANNTADETVYLTFVDGATGSQGIETDTNLTYNPSTNILATTATSAQYADLAERYTADQDYEAGTVVVFSNKDSDYELTESTRSHDRAVAGVISTNPAYLMNSTTEGVALALQGRVPCKVLGPIQRGDLVVTSNTPGTAQRLDDSSYLPGVVIGKALGTIEDDSVQPIEVVVGRL